MALKPEKYYTGIVKDWAKDYFDCEATARNRGMDMLGSPDVIAVKGQGAREKILLIEVKTRSTALGRKLGQAYAYSLYGHQIYLAIPFQKGEAFIAESIMVAKKLGVGLIRIGIRKNGTVTQCRVAQKSKSYTPVKCFRNRLLHNALIFRCRDCGEWVEGNPKKLVKTINPPRYWDKGTKTKVQRKDADVMDSDPESWEGYCNLCATEICKE